ncbi:MAG: MBL fold metallo-hydrolase [Burkholderiales bacterium]|nr:MBL fold metallo-hydrolase [Burkholderiales bacterium]
MPTTGRTLPHPALAGLTVLERGWLSSNNILIHAALGEPGAVLVDTGHVVHREQTLALVRHALQRAADASEQGSSRGSPRVGRLDRIVNTHLHSDHCGGNALLQQALGVTIVIPPGLADAVRAWDLARLSHDDFGLRERFHFAATLAPGESFVAGGRRWQALAAPGHDPHSLVLFDADAGLLLSADALWENGFGVVFPELVGESGFDEVGATLDMIERLPVRLVVPGHGAPFTDVAAALARARSRLAGFRADPARHARHAVKVLVKYHMMERGRLPLAELLRWSAAAPLLRRVWSTFGAGRAAAPTPEAWMEGFVRELAGAGALAMEGGDVLDR